jgi:hypothetical protein
LGNPSGYVARKVKGILVDSLMFVRETYWVEGDKLEEKVGENS